MAYCFIRGGIKLQSNHNTVQTWFMDPCMVRDTSLRICRKYLIRWIAFSTWIRTAAIVWFSVTSSWESWYFCGKKEGMLSVTPKGCYCFFYCKSSICHNTIILISELFFQNAKSFNNFNIRCRAILKIINKCYCPRWRNSCKNFISDMVLVTREQALLNC